MLKEIKTETEHFFIDKNRLKQGEYRDYHFNGQLWEHSFYLNNKRHGDYKVYHKNGQLWVHSFYQNDKRHGDFRRYNEDSELEYATFYYQNKNLNVNPDALTERDKTYIMLSGRLPPRDQPC